MDSIHFIVEESVCEDVLQAKQIRDLIEKEVEKLPSKQKKVLKLRVFEDLSFKEISEIMACPYDTAKANYRHGLLKLKKRFEQDNLIYLKEILLEKARVVHKKYELV